MGVDRIGLTDIISSKFSVCWSAIHEKWFFLPRRVSPEKYDDKKDELMGSNILLIADELFKNIEKRFIGPKIPSHGFSSFKFLPYSNDDIIGRMFTIIEGGGGTTLKNEKSNSDFLDIHNIGHGLIKIF